MIASFGIVGAIFTAWAIACADSSAGMMPPCGRELQRVQRLRVGRADIRCARSIEASQASSGPTPG